MNWADLLFGFRGRIQRQNFWIGIGVLFLIRLVFGVGVFAVVLASNRSGQEAPTAVAITLGLLAIPLYVAVVWILFAVMVKRCHDRDKSGWFSLLILIPLVGFVWAIIDLGCLEGTLGSNPYGPSPKGIDAGTAETFA